LRVFVPCAALSRAPTGDYKILWIITHKETVETPRGAVQVVHIEREDEEITLVLERPAADDDMTKAEMSALAFAQDGLIIDYNDID
jgi:hypothetical protein